MKEIKGYLFKHNISIVSLMPRKTLAASSVMPSTRTSITSTTSLSLIGLSGMVIEEEEEEAEEDNDEEEEDKDGALSAGAETEGRLVEEGS